MKKKKFITRVVLLFLLVTGCLTFRSIQAAGNNSVKFTFELPQKQEGDYDYGDQLEDNLVFDLYYIAPIKWDGAGDGVHADSTKYYIPYSEIKENYQSLFTSFKDAKGDINVSERNDSLVNTDLKNYGLDALANDIATKVFSALAYEDVPVSLITTSETEISPLVANEYYETVSRILTKEFL